MIRGRGRIPPPDGGRCRDRRGVNDELVLIEAFNQRYRRARELGREGKDRFLR
jgi:hypothetical protein